MITGILIGALGMLAIQAVVFLIILLRAGTFDDDDD